MHGRLPPRGSLAAPGRPAGKRREGRHVHPGRGVASAASRLDAAGSEGAGARPAALPSVRGDGFDDDLALMSTPGSRRSSWLPGVAGWRATSVSNEGLTRCRWRWARTPSCRGTQRGERHRSGGRRVQLAHPGGARDRSDGHAPGGTADGAARRRGTARPVTDSLSRQLRRGAAHRLPRPAPGPAWSPTWWPGSPR